MFRWNQRQARLSLLLFLFIFCLGIGKASFCRPVCPDFSRMQGPLPGEGSILDATALGRALCVFPSGTPVFGALSGLGVKVDSVGSGFTLPRAGVLLRTERGWSVRVMTQRERWIWRIPMDVHCCTPEDLSRIRGIGPSLGEKIHGFVRQRKSLESLDALLEVPGIGPSRLLTIQKELGLN